MAVDADGMLTPTELEKLNKEMSKITRVPRAVVSTTRPAAFTFDSSSYYTTDYLSAGYATVRVDPYSTQLELDLPNGRRLAIRTDIFPCYCHASPNAYSKCPVVEHRTNPKEPQELDRVRIGDQEVVLLTNGKLRHEPVNQLSI